MIPRSLALVFILLLFEEVKAETAPDEFIQRGLQKYNKSDFQGAIAEYDNAIKADSKNAKAYYNRAIANYAGFNVDAAIVDATRAAEINPSIDANPRTLFEWLVRGLRKWKNKDLDGALVDINQALQLDPKSARAFTNRGAVKSDKNDSDGALADFTQAIELDPKFATPYFNRGFEKARKNIDGALADCNEPSN